MSKLDLTNYRGREHAYIKHYLLAKYLPRLWYKTGSKWDPLVFIDGSPVLGTPRMKSSLMLLLE